MHHKLLYALTGLIMIAFAVMVAWQWYDYSPSPTNNPGAINVKLSQDFNLNFNQSARFGDYTFTFTKLINDSRCPEGVACFTAGDVKVVVEIKRGMQITPAELSLSSSPSTIVGDYKLELISVAPYPKADMPASEESYHIGLVLIKRGGVIQ